MHNRIWKWMHTWKIFQFNESLWILPRLFSNPRETISYLDTEDEGEGERQHDQQRGEPGQDESAWPGARGVSWNMMSSGENLIRRVQGVRSKYCCVIIVYGTASKSDQRKQFYYGSFYHGSQLLPECVFRAKIILGEAGERRWLLNGFLVANRNLWEWTKSKQSLPW